MTQSAGKVLVVEDDKECLILLMGTLGEAGYLVQPAGTLRMAFSWLNDNKPDLVIIDLKLPDGNGMDLCRSIRKSPETSKVPVIILTGNTKTSSRVDASLSGANLYLSKPMDLAELVHAIKGFLGPKGSQQQRRGVLRREGFEIDPNEHKIFYNGKTLKDIPEKLLDVLYILIEHYPKIVSRTHILSIVDPQDRDREVDVWICRLREKLSEFFHRDFIETVFGEGYRFSLPSPLSKKPI